MIRILIVLLFIAASVQAQKKKAVFIIVDGIPADVIEKLQPPTLNEISKTGGFSKMYQGGIKGSYNQTPTISAPGYTNIITGVWGNKHNVWDNDINDPNYHYLNIFRLAKKVRPSIKTAIFSTWTDNRTKLALEDPDHYFDGLELDTVNYPHDKNSEYIKKIDAAVVNDATQYIQQQGPDLSWVYLEYTDDMGHQHGDSDEFRNAVLNVDSEIKKIWEAIKHREQTMNEDWLLIITTDHGRTADTGKDHGGQSDRERAGWLVTNSKKLNQHFNNNVAAVDILPSICNHLGIAIPDEQRVELDGIPFIGPLEIADLRASKEGNKIVITWKSYVADDRKLDVLISPANNFRKGDEEQYVNVASVPVKDQKFQVVFRSTSNFYKVVIKTPNQALNTWIK